MSLGAHYVLCPTLTSELFGLEFFASNYSLVAVGPYLATFLLSTVLAGRIYQAVGKRHGDSSNECLGPDCFRWESNMYYNMFVGAGHSSTSISIAKRDSAMVMVLI